MVTFLTTCLTVSTQYEDGQGVHSWIKCGRAKKLKERVARWLLACQCRCWVTTLSGSTPACAVWADEECGECGRSLWGRSSWTGRWLDVRTCAVWWQSRCRTRARASELWQSPTHTLYTRQCEVLLAGRDGSPERLLWSPEYYEHVALWDPLLGLVPVVLMDRHAKFDNYRSYAVIACLYQGWIIIIIIIVISIALFTDRPGALTTSAVCSTK